jgi:hypothetical protein
MSGRALFTLVWLIVAAGLLLPLYPQGGQTPGTTAAPDAMALVAAPDAFGGPDDPIGIRCRTGCRCDGLLAAVFGSVDDPFGPSVTLTVWFGPAYLPSGPQPLLLKLPAI